MSVINNPLLLGQEGGGGYAISRSLRFNSSDSAYLSRTPASAGNRKTFTFAAWIKRARVANAYNESYFFSCIFSPNNSDTNYFRLGFAGDKLLCGGYSMDIRSAAVYRDFSAWYHVVVAVDTTQATASNRVKLYVNGSQVTDLSGATYPSQNTDLAINSTNAHRIGYTPDPAYGHDGLLADIHFCDGTAYDASAFGEFDANGIWQPKKFAGVYGTNGFKLSFSDNSTAAALGTDSSGQGNTWTVNNLSVTAGAGNDSLVDVPTNGSEVDTGSGGQVRGNYCTWNPLAKGGDIQAPTNGNLQVTSSGSGYGLILGTIGVSTGKWYWEVTTTSANCATGIATNQANLGSYGGADAYSWVWASYSGGSNKRNNNSGSSYGSILANGDVVGIAFDADAGTLTFYKNGVSQGNAYTGIAAGTYLPVLGDETTGANIDLTANFGQRPFAYTAPSGFKALCTANLPAPLVTKPSDLFDIVTYVGDGASTKTVSGLAFSPDLIWTKARSQAYGQNWYDIVRGGGKVLRSDITDAELTNSSEGYVSSFTSDGYVGTAGSNSAKNVNENGTSYVAWAWDAGSSTVTNTQGSITSSVRANATAGFSIVSFTGPVTTSTVGHGLGVAPSMIILKNRDQGSAGYRWCVYHVSTGNTQALFLDGTNAAGANSAYWGNTTPTSTVFTVGTAIITGAEKMIAYCFAPVAGYSSFGSYVGNGSADGPFVYTGFRPRWILIKQSSASGENWIIYDAAREPSNVSKTQLYANLSNAEFVSGTSPNGHIDLLSNGFKCRETTGGTNGSSATYIYAAFAESPFQYARAR